ncbi:MAG: bifunctional DNA primase/polymerase [Chloroflexota bacterium]
MLFLNYFQTLLTAAEAYSYLGWSMIPLLGDLDPTRSKTPALPWSGYQTYRASLNDYEQWFSDRNFGGLGIVTGRISQLVVLDFDSEHVFNDFRVQYPDLVETHAVRSAGRQLPHLYYKLPDYLHLESQRGEGIDLLSNGRYVVAPPTLINNQAYTITRGGMPKVLTERDIRRLQAFLTARKTRLPALISKPDRPTSISTIKSTTQPPKPTQHDLERLYHYYCQRGGRNEALFRTSLYARDTGWTEDETRNGLVQPHIQQAASDKHAKEMPAHRQREAQKTIGSAFSRPARPIKSRARPSNPQMSNSAREALIQQKMTFVVRTHEGLHSKGIQAGQFISGQQAVELLKGLVGRDSILAALKAKHNGLPIFAPVSPHNAVATDNSLQLSKTAYLIERKNQEKPQGGRPTHYYKMPSNRELCQLLEVEITSSDPLTAEDYASARQMRMGLQRELIKRRPGQYPRRWLARRLGITKRTLDTYHRLIPIQKRVMYFETPITWKTIERLPFDEPLKGAFLESDHGKKYPALRIVASQLLAAGKGVCLKQRAANFYWYGAEEPAPRRLQIEQNMTARAERLQTFITQKVHVLETRPSIPKNKPAVFLKQKGSHQNFHHPLKDAAQEAQAQMLYNGLNQMSAKQLSLANARRLITQYDAASLATALDRLKTFKSLTNPVGLLVILLRSNQNENDTHASSQSR